VARLFIPTIVLGELCAGALRIEDLLEDVNVLDFDHTCAQKFGEIRCAWFAKGSPSQR